MNALNDRLWGPPIDQELWSRILVSSADDLVHRLWCAVIREIAKDALTYLPEELASIEYEDDISPNTLIREWLDEELPIHSDLAQVLDELNYFRDYGLPWDEKLNFSGQACFNPVDVVCDVKDLLSSFSEAQDVVTKESVEDFYAEWRTRFFRKVLQTSEKLKQAIEQKGGRVKG